MASSPTRTRRAARRSRLGHELLEAFERLIAEGETWATLSIDRLATEAGISRSTFYVYFEDKSDLLNALGEEVIAGLVSAAEEWWTITDDVSVEEIERALRGITDVYIAHHAIWQAIVETAASDARMRREYATLIQFSRDRFETHIATGQRAGFVAPDVDPEHAAGWLTWMTERGLVQLVAPANDARRERLVRALTHVVWNSLYRDVS